MEKNEELKKCPFCGGEAEAYEYPPKIYNVECLRCNASILSSASMGTAVKRWNRRQMCEECKRKD